jgi:ABC-type uncharacterized transport system involved in gliding motility auxiliary subunit
MKASPRLQLQMLAQNGLFALLLAAGAFLAVYAVKDSRLQWDITQNQRNTLSQGTRDVLASMAGPITITAYATPQDATLGDVRRLISDFIAPYRRAKPDLMLAFVNPLEQPKQAAAANVRSNGELVIEYGTRSEHLTNLNEQAMANLLQRLARSQERLIMYVDGHGQPKLDGQANFDLGDFGRQLGTKGFRIQGLNLAVAPEVPDNAAVLVITPPRVDMLEGEVDKVKRFVERGGNLLWLIDQAPLHGLQPLAEQLRLDLTPGVVVDPASARLGIEPTIALSASYGFHPITEDFSAYNTAFPFVRRIAAQPEATDWRATTLVEVAANGWVETGDLDKGARFDQGRDTRGPVPIAVAMERSKGERTQRIVAAGGSSFLSNAFVGLLSNQDLGTNMLNWLAEDESLITIQPRARVDGELNLTRTSLAVIATGFLAVLPGAFLLAGGMIWWRRRRRA